jgi:Druantia protein DruA
MDVLLTYRGRRVTEADAASIRALIAAHPEASRRQLSYYLCDLWDWRQPNGERRDMVCRGLMLALDRAGHIRLPAVRQRPPNNVVAVRAQRAVWVDGTALEGGLAALGPLRIRQVRRSPEERLFDGLISEHHYLGYTRPVGEHLKYLVWAHERPVACLGWSSAPRHLGPRDRFIGWSAAARRRNIGLLAYNTRFLILPWVKVKHLASHLLGRVARQIAMDWEELYGHPVHYLETFVEPARFRGTCYRAANRISLGLTTGRGKDDQTHRANRPLKEVLGYPLTRRFRALLTEGA